VFSSAKSCWVKVVLKIVVFLHLMLFDQVAVYLHFGGMYCHHLLGREVKGVG
jgi:hypothetical protein